ncbi:unnamed protein product [Oikopleura dioica]|uniref:Uncharacterized protein n=1 Tax=Oikopleura dioica TaxID=34765 RepID=E4Z011_OIKDI|nr:unnamed protein product [Oikopleura dioica]
MAKVFKWQKCLNVLSSPKSTEILIFAIETASAPITGRVKTLVRSTPLLARSPPICSDLEIDCVSESLQYCHGNEMKSLGFFVTSIILFRN